MARSRKAAAVQESTSRYAALAERVYRFGLGTIQLAKLAPNDPITRHITIQLMRSGTSAAANYEEARRGRSRAEFAAKMGDALRELAESILWLRYLEDAALLITPQVSALRDEAGQLTAIFRKSLQTVRSSP